MRPRLGRGVRGDAVEALEHVEGLGPPCAVLIDHDRDERVARVRGGDGVRVLPSFLGLGHVETAPRQCCFKSFTEPGAVHGANVPPQGLEGDDGAAPPVGAFVGVGVSTVWFEGVLVTRAGDQLVDGLLICVVQGGAGRAAAR